MGDKSEPLSTNQRMDMIHIKEKYQSAISSILLDGFEVELLDSALINLLTPNSLRLNNFAYALRELTRHMLLFLVS